MNLQSTQVCRALTSYINRHSVSSQYAENKGFAEDLTEGKFSFPIVHGVRADTSNRQILSQPLNRVPHLLIC